MRDHPRVCGEHVDVSVDIDNATGSSPRMRGTLFRGRIVNAEVGIIPAYAGNTCRTRSPHPRRKDHPRVCGEHKITAGGASMEAGSSPRMRGTPSRFSIHHAADGIIPAYAGNTYARSIVTVIFRDHPRVCGEHWTGSTCATVRAGSSPRMRGTLSSALFAWQFDGIIPAYAGNTRNPRKGQHQSWDHPRVCGEHFRVSCLSAVVQGSSPRMRGTPFRLGVVVFDVGIIPAYAGNTPFDRADGLR